MSKEQELIEQLMPYIKCTTAKYWRRAGFVALLLIVAQMMDKPQMLIVSGLPAFCQYIVSCRFSSAYNLTN